jgi:hypothetical protein
MMSILCTYTRNNHPPLDVVSAIIKAHLNGLHLCSSSHRDLLKITNPNPQPDTTSSTDVDRFNLKFPLHNPFLIFSVFSSKRLQHLQPWRLPNRPMAYQH